MHRAVRESGYMLLMAQEPCNTCSKYISSPAYYAGDERIPIVHPLTPAPLPRLPLRGAGARGFFSTAASRAA